MPNPLAVLGDSLKASFPIVERLPFANYGGSGVQTTNMPVFFADGLQQSWVGAGGQPHDFSKLGAEPLANSVIAAGVDAYTRALPEAPLILENFKGPRKSGGSGGEWERVEQHEALDIFNAPDSPLSDAEIWGLTGAHKITRGLSYWFLPFNRSLSKPVEIWPTLPERVKPNGDENTYISGYTITSDSGKQVDVSPEQVIHFRHLPNLYDYRRGWTPLDSGRTALVGDNAVNEYHASILLNSGVMSLLVSVESGEAQGRQVEVTPDNFETFINNMRRKLMGSKSANGGIEGTILPLKLQKMSFSPDEMAVEKLMDFFEMRLCALMGIPRKILDLGTDPTYLNMAEAKTDFWLRRIIPDRNNDAATLNRQLIPLFFSEGERRNWRYGFDFSKVRALQENTDALFTRWMAVFNGGGCDLATLHSNLGQSDVPDEYKGRFAKALVQLGAAAAGATTPASAEGGKDE